MKKKIAFIITFILIISAGFASFAKDTTAEESIDSRKVIDSIKISDHKRNILYSYGLTDQEIESLTMSELKKLLFTNNVVDTSFVKEDTFTTNAFAEESVLIEKLMLEKGVSKDELELLVKNYQIETLLNMNSVELSKVKNTTKVIENNITQLSLSQETLTTKTNVAGYYLPSGQYYDYDDCEINHAGCTCPNKYICIGTIPYGGGSHDSIYVNNLRYNTINTVASNAREMASRMFQQPTSSVVATYNLWSEWGEGWVQVDGVWYDASTWLHEGVDMQTTVSSKKVYSPLDYGYAKVVYSDATTVCIYDSDFEVTIAYQHVTNSWDEGDIVPAYAEIGTYSGHLHVGVIDGKCETEPWKDDLSGRDLVLETTIPYGYINWYDKY